MYIDEIKKLLKDIEKSVQGDRRWIENEDYLLKDKMEKILEKDTTNLNNQQPILIPNEFILPQQQKKNNIISQISNFSNKDKEIIKLPSQIVNKRMINNTKYSRSISSNDFTLMKGFDVSVSANDINGKVINGSGSLNIKDFLPNIDLSKINIKGLLNLQMNQDMEITKDLPKNSNITLSNNSNVKISASNINGLNVSGDGNLTITDLLPDIDLSNIFNNGSNKFFVDNDLDFKGKLCKGEIVVAEGKTLRISAKEANGRKITGKGKVIITDIDNYPDADLSLIDTDEHILEVSKPTNFSGKLNKQFKIDLKNGSLFSIFDDEADQLEIFGNGQVSIKNNNPTAPRDKFDFSKFSVQRGISTSKNQDIQGLDKNIPINVPEGETLYLTANEANNRIITGDGNVVITDLDKNPNVDLSKINTNGSVIVDLKENTNFTGKLNPNTKIKLSKGVKLTSVEDILGSIKIFGDGSVEDENGRRKVIPLDDDNIIYLEDGQELRISAKDANGKRIIGKGKVIIDDLDKYPNVDLSGINPENGFDINLNKSTNFTGKLPFNKSKLKVNLLNDSIFGISSEEANNLEIDGEGSVNVTNLSDKYTDLSKINPNNGTSILADKNLKFNGKLPNNKSKTNIKVNEGVNFDVSEDEIKGIKISGNGKINRKQIKDIKKPIVLTNGETKYITAEEADGMIITGNGKVIITDLHKNPNVDLSKINPDGDVILDVDEDVDFNGKINPKTKINLRNNAKITDKKDQLNNKTIFGFGSIFNSSNKERKFNDNKIIVPKGKVLKISAAEANGKTIIGEGKVIITDLDKTPDADLRKIDTETEIDIDNDVKFNGTLPKKSKINLKNGATITDLKGQTKGKKIIGKGKIKSNDGSVTNIDKKDTDDIINVPKGQVLRISAADANGKTIIGEGKVIITKLDETPDANLSNIDTETETELDIEKDVNFKGTLPKKSKINLKNGSKLTIKAKDADKLKVSGDGSVDVEDIDEKDDVDLSNFENSGNTKLKVKKSTKFKGKLPKDKSKTEFEIPDKIKLTIEAKDADKLKVNGNGSVDVVNLDEKDDVDLSNFGNTNTRVVKTDETTFNGKLPIKYIFIKPEDLEKIPKQFEVKYKRQLDNLNEQVDIISGLLNLTLEGNQGVQEGGNDKDVDNLFDKLDLEF